MNGSVGWELDEWGRGIGRHFAKKYQDPTLVRPGLQGPLYRTTLVEGDDHFWYVMELCERVADLVQLDADFIDLKAKRNVITILTDGEKDPLAMGFKLCDESPDVFPVRFEGNVQADDGDDVDLPDADDQVEGREIPEGQIAIRLEPDDEVTVNGTKLTVSSSLAALRARCTFYNLSTSGSKQRCFQRIMEHLKKIELAMVMATAKDAKQEMERQPSARPAVTPPSEAEQALHRLTHLPYANWCPSCLSQRGRPDRHERTRESHAGEVPTVSFDFFYTRADGEEEPDENTPDAVLGLIMVCSATGFVACVPLQGKGQLEYMNRELVQFIQRLGYSEVILRCDNEPAILQLQRLTAKTRQSMGLRTRVSSSVAYHHGNALAENAIARVRQLAASLMHQLHGRIGIQLFSALAIWTWALRHAAWLISRFSVLRGATPYELAFGRRFAEDLCEYGEPVYGYVYPGTNKAAAIWRRALFLGNSDTQNSYVLFDGHTHCKAMMEPLFVKQQKNFCLAKIRLQIFEPPSV